MMIQQKATLRLLVFVIFLFFGSTALAHASSILMTDSDPFSTAQYIGNTDLFYTHDISDNGYNPLSDTVINATLSINFIENVHAYRTTVAMFDFEGTDEEELTVVEGDQLVVLRYLGEWVLVQNQYGEVGYVPTTYTSLGAGGVIESESFQLSFDGISQSIYQIDYSWPLTETWYQFTVPTTYLFDGSLDLNIHAATGDFMFQDALLSVTIERTPLAPVPEPSTMVLLGSGLATLAWYGRKRKKI